MVHLRPMSQAEFQQWLAATIKEYGVEKVLAGSWKAEEAQQLSEQEFQQLLPDGLASKDQHLFSIVDDEQHSPVGIIWFAVRTVSLGPIAFIFDFMIFEQFRRKGYGVQAMRLVEDNVKALGLDRIVLHVFGHNRAAQQLYEKAGYEVTDIQMTKKLSTDRH